jgi:hypothetical protein
MHTGVTQLTGIHPLEVCGILEIDIHIAVIWCKITHYFIYKRTICEKSENHGVICENKVSENRRTFADGNEKRVLRKLKNEFSISNLLNRDLTSAILGCTSAKQASLIAFGLHEHCARNTNNKYK